MLNAYRNNPYLQQHYLKINKITHAEIWEQEGGFVLAICTQPGVGFPESPLMDHPDQCKQWLDQACQQGTLPLVEC